MGQPERPPLPENVVELLNASRGGFNIALGLVFTSVSYDKISATIDINEGHHQPYGLVHGGVLAAMVETLASAGAAVNAMANGQHAVGLENSTSFLRAARGGSLLGTAIPLTRGRRTQVWQVTIRDLDERVLASGRVRMLALEHDAAIAGETVTIKPEPAAD